MTWARSAVCSSIPTSISTGLVAKIHESEIGRQSSVQMQSALCSGGNCKQTAAVSNSDRSCTNLGEHADVLKVPGAVGLRAEGVEGGQAAEDEGHAGDVDPASAPHRRPLPRLEPEQPAAAEPAAKARAAKASSSQRQQQIRRCMDRWA